jgi:ribosomal protein L7Ae-like RNA K-turn-binding protein
MTMSSRPTKRQRKEHPQSLLDNESLACVASPDGSIRTPVVCHVTKEIILDRLDKEICKPFHFSLKVPRADRPKIQKNGKMISLPRGKATGTKIEDPIKALVKSRIKIGTNECTRALESKSVTMPELIILARDVHPPTILAHIPYLAKNTSILLLPGRASFELGKVLGAKKVAIMVFLQRPKDTTEQQEHDRIDSIVAFLKQKIPQS